MKQIKFSLIVLILTIFTFTSCKDESIDITKNTVESVAARNATNALSTHFNPDGTLRDGENPTNNIIFDFCFDFVYPITLSYNTGAEVTVENFEGMVELLINMTEDLYINGISFPFQVEVFNADTDAFEVITIQGEDSFIALLESCSIDDDGQTDDCQCMEIYEPVCVEVGDGSGEEFIIEFPNMCYAECSGFTQDDVVECDYSNPCNGGFFDNDCFDFVYPLSVVLPNGETVQVENEDDLEDIIYTNYYFDFHYPITVEVEVDGAPAEVNIHNAEEFAALLAECEDVEPGDDCEINDLSVVVGDCFSQTAYTITLDFNLEDPVIAQQFMVVFYDGTEAGPFQISALPINLEVDVNTGDYDSLSVYMLSGGLTCAQEVDWEIPSCN
jgi:hypothetical protein